jgi:DNA mismatch repair protein MutS
MSFQSILFGRSLEGEQALTHEAPAFFRDLNLDQVVESITSGRQEYDLKPFYYTRLTGLAAISYRHEVMRDLETASLLQSCKSFSAQMRAMREHLTAAEKLSYTHQKNRWFLNAAEIYCNAVEALVRDLDKMDPKSAGLRAFHDHLVQYAKSDEFKTLLTEGNEIKAKLSAIRYCVLIKGSRVTVRTYDSEIDYSAVIEDVFAKFKQGAAKDYRVGYRDSSDLNHIEAQILDFVAELNPEAFLALERFCVSHGGFANKTICTFDREIQFYISYLEFSETLKRGGLKFCYPLVSDSSKAITNREGFDLALASKLVRDNALIVCNDFFLRDKERIFVVSGPNQGGKTTFARTFGQLHYLASLGCPVPGAEARLFLFDQIYTHFEKAEDIKTLRGKLQDDLDRIHQILNQATANSVIIMNEIFSSTTLEDAVYLSGKVVESIARVDSLCVCVTFLDELSRLNEKTVSVVATVVPENPTKRTHKIERRPADGLSYAVAIAEKYGLTYGQLKNRIKS